MYAVSDISPKLRMYEKPRTRAYGGGKRFSPLYARHTLDGGVPKEVFMLKHRGMHIVSLLVCQSHTFSMIEFQDQGRNCLMLKWPDDMSVSEVIPKLRAWILNHLEVDELEIIVHKSHNNQELIPRLIQVVQEIKDVIEVRLVALNESVQQEIVLISGITVPLIDISVSP